MLCSAVQSRTFTQLSTSFVGELTLGAIISLGAASAKCAPPWLTSAAAASLQRRLPHAHIVVFLAEKPTTPEQVDKIVSATIPCPDTQPRLHGKVKKNMIHGTDCVLHPRSASARTYEC
jgi:hypothetical protein